MIDGPRAMAARQPQVGEQIQRLDKAISHAVELRQKLEERISVILRNGGPTFDGPKPDRTQMVPMAEELANIIERVDVLSNGLDDILQRVEL